MSLLSNIKKMFGSDEPEETNNSCKENHSEDIVNKSEESDKEVNEDNDPFDFKKMDLAQFIIFNNEMMRDIPDDMQIRLVENPKIKLRDFLVKARVVNASFKADWFYIVNVDWKEKEFHYGKDFDSYCIFDDLLELDEKNQLYPKGESRNTLIYMSYTDGKGDGYIELNIMLDGRLGDDMLLLNRAAVAHKRPGAVVPECTKILFTFSLTSKDDVLHNIVEWKKKGLEKLRNKQELDFYEVTALGFSDNYKTYFEDGMKLMSEKRWGDAISSFTNAYYKLKEILLTERDSEALDLFCKTCRYLGECYYRKHLYSKASFYLERSCSIEEHKDAVKLFEECMVHMNDLRVMKPESESFNKDTFILENVFETLFDIIPGELADMLCIDNKNKTQDRVTRQKDILQYDVRKAMENTDSMTLHLSYRYHTTIIDDEYVDTETLLQNKNSMHAPNENVCKETTTACIDKSIRMTDNIVVINLSKKDHVITMNVMVPRFRFSDNNNYGYPKCVTLQYFDSEYISRTDFEKFRSYAAKKNNSKQQLTYEEYHSLASQPDAAFYFANGCIAFGKKMFGDSLFYLSKVCNMLLVKRASDTINDADKSMVFESFYILGFIYLDLKNYEWSVNHLSLLQNFGNLNWNMEYINSLTNSKDIYAYGVVAKELERLKHLKEKDSDNNDYNNYNLFLLRRMSHILIDKEAYDDAEKLLTDLLQYPNCKDYAEKELNYIKLHRE